MKRLIRINYKTEKEEILRSYSRLLHQNLQRSRQVLWIFFSLYTGDFVAYIAVSFSGYFCFLKAKELSSIWLPRRAAPTWKAWGGKRLGFAGKFLFLAFSDCFLDISQSALVCVVGRIPRQSHNLYDQVLWSITAVECRQNSDLLLAHKYVTWWHIIIT